MNIPQMYAAEARYAFVRDFRLLTEGVVCGI
jgi:hypothetical protein